MNAHRNRKSRLIALVVFALFLYILLTRTNPRKILDSFAQVSWGWAIGAALLNIFNTWIEAWRWKLILSSTKKEVKVSKAFAALLAGVVANIILPLKLGEGVRAYFVSRKEEIHFSSAFSAVVVDRLADIISFFILILVTAFFFPFGPQIRRMIFAALGLVAVGIASLVVIIRLNSNFSSKGKLGRKLAEQINHFKLGLRALQDGRIMGPVAVLSALFLVIRLTTIYLMFNALHFTLPLIAVAVTLILVNLGTVATSIPANLGGFEFSILAALKIFSVNTEAAISFAITLHLIEVVPVVLLGIATIWINGFSFRLLQESKDRLRSTAFEGNK
jgi:uncharacterized protein (TIRG00374 family)